MIINNINYPIEVRTHKWNKDLLIVDKSKCIKYGYAAINQDQEPKTTTQDNLNVNYSNIIKWQNMDRKTKRLICFVLLQMGIPEPLDYFNSKYMKG